jgi:N-acetyl-anhydromuramyl-L-alanine amidase AmpD
VFRFGSAIDDSLGPRVEDRERRHTKDFSFTLDLLSKYNYKDELLFAAKEEYEALQKIIEAYNRRFKPQNSA